MISVFRLFLFSTLNKHGQKWLRKANSGVSPRGQYQHRKPYVQGFPFHTGWLLDSFIEFSFDIFYRLNYFDFTVGSCSYLHQSSLPFLSRCIPLHFSYLQGKRIAAMACTFDSPSLTSQVNGAVPTSASFSNTNHFEIPASLTHSQRLPFTIHKEWLANTRIDGTKCFSTSPVALSASFVPVFLTGSYTFTCSFHSKSSQSSIDCPTLPNSAIPPGIHTML